MQAGGSTVPDTTQLITSVKALQCYVRSNSGSSGKKISEFKE